MSWFSGATQGLAGTLSLDGSLPFLLSWLDMGTGAASAVAVGEGPAAGWQDGGRVHCTELLVHLQRLPAGTVWAVISSVSAAISDQETGPVQPLPCSLCWPPGHLATCLGWTLSIGSGSGPGPAMACGIYFLGAEPRTLSARMRVGSPHPEPTPGPQDPLTLRLT